MYYINNNFTDTTEGSTVMHKPVLLTEVMDFFKSDSGGSRYLDCTFGGGSHTRSILDSAPDTEVLALDRDPSSVKRSDAVMEEYGDRFSFRQMNFAEIGVLEDESYNGILFDLGVSSFQLDEAERGFSYRFDAPLDLRMDPDCGISASDFLETSSYDELVHAVRDLGEEKSWWRVVNAIIESRGTGSLDRTSSFSELIENIVGRGNRKSKIHPATRTFQGVRIAVNGELDALEEALPEAVNKLVDGGVLIVISFHSLEDRIVKRFFKRMAGKPEHAGDYTAQQDRESRAVILTKRPITAGRAELEDNPRSRSAKLRALKKGKA